MKANGISKSKAFKMCFWAVMFIFAAMFVIGVISGDYAVIPVPACLAALCSVTGGYIGLQAANNGIKGKFWNQEMFKAENPKQEGANDIT